MAKIKINNAALRKMEKQAQQKLDKMSKQNPIKPGDSEADIRKALTRTAKAVGDPNQSDIRRAARDIHDDLNK